MMHHNDFFTPDEVDRQIDQASQLIDGDRADAEMLAYLRSSYQREASVEREMLDRIWSRIAPAIDSARNELGQESDSGLRDRVAPDRMRSQGPGRGRPQLRPEPPRSTALRQRLELLVAVLVLACLIGGAAYFFTTSRGKVTVPPAASPTPQTQPTVTPVPATATPTHPAGPVVTTSVAGITMFSATTGWGSVPTSNPNIAGGIAYTVDGGHTWYNVTPSGLTLAAPSGGGAPNDGTIALYPLSATEAWSWLSFDAGGGSSTTLWHTTDAGAHWSTSTVATGAVTHLDFVDSLHGWLDASPGGAAAGLFPISVWSTTDGGATWAQVTSYRVWAGTLGMSFANDTTGFGCSDSDGGPLILYVTHDAGSTWSTVSLPTPSGYSGGQAALAGLPIFTSATAGVLEVSYGLGPSSPPLFTVYRTADAGTSWQLGPSLSGTPGTGFAATSFLRSVLANGQVFAAVAVSGQVTLYQLPDGATTWTKINTGGSSLALLSGLTQLDFVSPNTGWAVTPAGLIGTADGGVTWAVLHA
ncbi:MAG: hypothetical protein ACLQUY_22095 [Ktedonobacterales bacterium]